MSADATLAHWIIATRTGDEEEGEEGEGKTSSLWLLNATLEGLSIGYQEEEEHDEGEEETGVETGKKKKKKRRSRGKKQVPLNITLSLLQMVDNLLWHDEVVLNAF